MSAQTKRPTPRTDDLMRGKGGLWEEWEDADFAELEAHARLLESQLAEAVELLEGLRSVIGAYPKTAAITDAFLARVKASQ